MWSVFVLSKAKRMRCAFFVEVHVSSIWALGTGGTTGARDQGASGWGTYQPRPPSLCPSTNLSFLTLTVIPVMCLPYVRLGLLACLLPNLPKCLCVSHSLGWSKYGLNTWSKLICPKQCAGATLDMQVTSGAQVHDARRRLSGL